jgi:pyruvate/2-oxoglutarate dehydrogenase complex dihydrolipoamide acyltransferase (E2) component
MKENKNIERLFQEKFKEFEVSPPDIVWENIQEKLQSDKKKRRLLPLWLNVGSIAASFAVLFTLLFLLLKEEPYFAGHLADDQKSVLLRKEIHMGIAVATPDGLTVPVLRNPDQKSIKQITN